MLFVAMRIAYLKPRAAASGQPFKRHQCPVMARQLTDWPAVRGTAARRGDRLPGHESARGLSPEFARFDDCNALKLADRKEVLVHCD